MSKHTIRTAYRTITNPRLESKAGEWLIAYSYRTDGQGRTYSGRERLGAMSRDEARVALEAWKTTQAKISSVVTVTILDQILEPYMHMSLAKAHPPKTFLRNATVLSKALGHTPIGQIDTKLLNDFAAARGIKPQSLRSYVGTLNAAFNFSSHERQISLADKRNFKLPAKAPPRDHWLRRQEADEVHARAMGESIGKAKLADITLLVGLAMDTGARAGALNDLTWDRVHLDAKLIDFRNPNYAPKNKRRVVIRIAKRLQPLLERAYRERDPLQETVLRRTDASVVFKSWIDSVAEWQGTRIGKTTLHALRHTFATLLITERGFPLDRVASLLGDTQKTVSEVYGHLLPSDTDFDL
jgi:integrase